MKLIIIRIYALLYLKKTICNFRLAGLLLFFLMPLFSAAQQNLFNIPSGDVNPKKKIFYQHQLNVYHKKVESKAHFVYGLGKGWEVGTNLVGKGAYFTPEWRLLYNSNPLKAALYPILMGTTQKQWSLSRKLKFNIGAQLGHNLSNKLQNKELCYFTYGIGTFLFGKGSRVVLGKYHGNRMFLGAGNNTGVLAGYELKMHKRWYLMGDWVSGNNDAGVAVIGGMYNVNKRIQVCAGWMIPNAPELKPPAVVFELNVVGWDVF